MDPVIATAGLALAAGDPLAALKGVALREDAPALALRGIAMAQLGDFGRARTLLRRAARGFGARHAVARARCVVAQAEIDLAARELGRDAAALTAARRVLAAHGDHANAAHAQFLEARRLLLIGRLDAADHALAQVDPAPLPPALQTAHALAQAGIAMRRIHAVSAQAALERAEHCARVARVPALTAEVEAAALKLRAPAARLIAQGESRPLLLGEVEAMLASDACIVDACRYVVLHANTSVRLASRPILFALARMLAEAWPQDASRDALITGAFRLRHADESLRARLRVEMGRLRRLLRPISDIRPTTSGFVLRPRDARQVVLLVPPVESKHAALLALLADGESWSSSALAMALDTSQRKVQRALEALAEEGTIQSVGRGRSRRWLTPPVAGFTTTLLLPATMPTD